MPLVPDAQCPLCRSTDARPYAEAHGRRYWACWLCGLIHMAAEHRPSPVVERAHYESHENDPDDPRYRAFLSRLADPLLERLPEGAKGLDYGSGPGPTLSVMLEERGFPTRNYDPIFAPDPAALERSYGFITCTETAEHFFRPGEEFARLDRMLEPGGILAIMTEMLRDERPLEEWWYTRDPTHVCFYRPETMEWIAGYFDWSLEVPHRNVAIFRKQSSL